MQNRQDQDLTVCFVNPINDDVGPLDKLPRPGDQSWTSICARLSISKSEIRSRMREIILKASCRIVLGNPIEDAIDVVARRFAKRNFHTP
jgi:hypothetical protein